MNVPNETEHKNQNNGSGHPVSLRKEGETPGGRD
jgi:hypothetical protein